MCERYSARWSARISERSTCAETEDRDRGQRTEVLVVTSAFLSGCVMHASSLTYTRETPTMHAESSTIEHLDEDWQPSCTTRMYYPNGRAASSECGRPATWFRSCSACETAGLSCERCREWSIHFVCHGCGAKPVEVWRWRPL